MKEKTKTYFLYIFLSVLILYALGSGIWNLVNSNERHTIVIEQAMPLIELEHTINGIIPMGTDYYYLGLEKDTQNIYIIQASKHWLDKAFDDGQSVQITALAKGMDWQVQRDISPQLDNDSDFILPLGTEKYLSLTYVKDSCMRIAGVLILLVLVGIFKYYTKNEITPKSWQRNAFLIIFCVDLVIILLSIV